MMQRDYSAVITMTHFLAKIYFSLIRVLKSKKKKLVPTLSFIVSVKKHDWMIHENSFT